MSLRSRIKSVFETRESVQGKIPLIQLKELDFDQERWNEKEFEVIYADIEVAVFNQWENFPMDAMSKPLQNVIYACNLNVSLDCSGILSFLDNGSGEHFEETLIALEEIGLVQAHEILRELKQTLGASIVPKDMAFRRELIENLLEAITDENSPFEKWDEQLSLNRHSFKVQVIEFVLKHLRN